MSSMPRNMVPELQASVTRPPLISVSMRRWPSIRVTGSMTTRAISVHLRRLFCSLFFFVRSAVVAGMEMVADNVADGMGGCGGGDSGDDGPANLAGGDIHTETGGMRQPFVEGRFRIPEARGGAGDTTVAGLHRPAGRGIPTHGWAVVIGLGPFAAHFEQ